MKFVNLTGRPLDCDECFSLSKNGEDIHPAIYRVTVGDIQIDLCANHWVVLQLMVARGTPGVYRHDG